MTLDHQKTGRRIIKSFEADQLKNRSTIFRIADWLTASFGSIEFFIGNGILFTLWIIFNTGVIPEIPKFDPFPFNFLTMTVSLEAIFLSVIVLMSQNRQSQITSLREELDMQVNLIAEREITMTLKVLKIMAKKMGLDIKIPEFKEMTAETDVSYIQTELEEQMMKLNKKQNLPMLPKNFLPKKPPLISPPEEIKI